VTIRIELAKAAPEGVDAVVVPVGSGGIEAAGLDATFAGARGFDASVGQTLLVPGADGGPATLAVGLGAPGERTTTTFRRAGAAVARASTKVPRLAATVLDGVPTGADAVDGLDKAGAAQAFAEGLQLASYRFTAYKSDPKPHELAEVVVVGTGKRVEAALELGGRIADAVCLARDLVNEPGGTLTPSAFAETAVEVAERENLQVSVLDRDDLAERGMGGLLGVNRGSSQPPAFVELTYQPSGKPRGALALVGKGITFDSGGLSLKTADGMMTMKSDMGGAAAVLAAMSVLGTLEPRVTVTGYLPLTDNMTGGDATRPGDVLRTRSGKTVEVLNTDAEGRLILADALALAGEAAPDAIIDLATLTGACEIALGKAIAGLMGNHEGWAAQVLGAADRVGERMWLLPLPKLYRPRIDSEVADLRNVAGVRDGGALTAGLFLQEFVPEGMPWAHVDIAGPAFAAADDGEIVKGGTGYGVRTLVELIRSFRKPR
jgi:leucyl aminopeptidase